MVSSLKNKTGRENLFNRPRNQVLTQTEVFEPAVQANYWKQEIICLGVTLFWNGLHTFSKVVLYQGSFQFSKEHLLNFIPKV